MPQHHDRREEERGGVGLVLAGDVGCGAVDGLEDGAPRAHVAGGGEAEAADEARAQVGDDVAVQVRHHQDVVLGGVLHHVQADSVEILLLEFDLE